MQTPVIYITSVYSTIEEKEQKKKKSCRVGADYVSLYEGNSKTFFEKHT